MALRSDSSRASDVGMPTCSAMSGAKSRALYTELPEIKGPANNARRESAQARDAPKLIAVRTVTRRVFCIIQLTVAGAQFSLLCPRNPCAGSLNFEIIESLVTGLTANVTLHSLLYAI